MGLHISSLAELVQFTGISLRFYDDALVLGLAEHCVPLSLGKQGCCWTREPSGM
jgi:hypothetical protein